MQEVDVIVIGAGISGSLAALKLPKEYKALLIEAGSSVLPVESSSHNECYKLHTGAHFIGDLATARHCLQRSVAFAREFPNFLAGDDLSSPWRRGRHYIMSNSLVSVARARNVVLQLQADYTQLVAEDERNKVFGEPENFVKFLAKDDYSYIAETIPFYDSDNVQTDAHVALAIETAESQIDIDKLQAYVQQQIQENPNLTFMPAHEVTRLARNPSAFGYLVTTKNRAGEEETFKTRAIVNCAWQNIETLDQTLGLSPPDDNRVVRIKVSILIELPKSLRNINTCIFSSGPYASITVLPNGTAVLTSERTTNAGFFKASAPIPDQMKELIANMTLETAQGLNVAQKILAECAAYVSEEVRADFQAAPIKELRVGFVKVTGAYTQQSIYQANSPIHARLEDGVEVLETVPPLVADAANKMTYAASNATNVSEILTKHLELLDKMEQLIARTKDKFYSTYPHLWRMNTLVDSLLHIDYRSFVAEKVDSLEYAHDPESCIDGLVKFLKTNLTVRRRDSFFSGDSELLSIKDCIKDCIQESPPPAIEDCVGNSSLQYSLT